MINYKNSGVFLLISGILSVLLSIFLIFIHFEEYSMNIKIMSLSFIVIGLFYIFYFVSNKKLHFRPGWTLSQGFYLIVIGILCFYTYDNELSDSMNLLFALWALASGSSQIGTSIQLRSLEFTKWYRVLIAGFCNLIFFVLFITEPFTQFVSVYTSFGIYIFFSGVICISELFNY